jgi:TonB family protein
MSKFPSFVFMILCAAAFVPTLVLGQKTGGKLPEQWGKYSVGDKNASVLFPEMPVKVADSSQQCNGLQSDKYGIFDDGAVYVLTISYKIKPTGYCEVLREFSRKDFDARVRSYSDGEKLPVGNDRDQTGLVPVNFKGKYSIGKLYNDPEHSRWFELSVVTAGAAPDESGAAVKAFLNSLEISEKPGGTEIGEGWLGNPASSSPTPAASPTPTPTPAPTPPPVEPSPDAGKTPPPDSIEYGTAGPGKAPGPPVKSNGAGLGGGYGPGPGGYHPGSGPSVAVNRDPITPLTLVLRATPPYTKEARKKQISGQVRVRVIFGSNGRITAVFLVSGLSHGLTEQAMAAARRIVFIPAHRNGVYISMSKIIEYNFHLY